MYFPSQTPQTLSTLFIVNVFEMKMRENSFNIIGKMSFIFKCHREKTWSWWHCKLPAFSAYNTNMDLIHISHIENQISVICFHIVIVHVCKLTYRVVLIWLENWSWATMAKANNASMNYRILFVLWNINQNIM